MHKKILGTVLTLMLGSLLGCEPEPPATDVVMITPQTLDYRSPRVMAVPEVIITPEFAAKVDSVRSLMLFPNSTTVIQGRAPQDQGCGSAYQIVFTAEGKQFTVWDTGQICNPGLRFYIRRQGSPRSGIRDSVSVIVDDSFDGRVDEASISGDWYRSTYREYDPNWRDHRKDFSPGVNLRADADYTYEVYWQSEYQSAIETTLAVLRRGLPKK